MKRELPAGAEKRCFVGSSFCFSDFEKLLLTTNTPIGIQGGNSVKKYGVNELRKMFLEFFESKGHLAMKSFSLVPHNDNSLLLINSGMGLL